MGTIVRRFGRAAGYAAVLGSALLAACSSGGGDNGTVELSVLSSSPQWVSGGDARIAVRVASDHHDKLEWWLNGAKVTPALQSSEDRLEGVITGLVNGENRLEVRNTASGKTDTLVLTNWPITGPMFTGPQQTPFTCTATQFGLQPLVDSASGEAVHPGFVTASGSVANPAALQIVKAAER